MKRNNSSQVKEARNMTGYCRYKNPSATLQEKKQFFSLKILVIVSFMLTKEHNI